LGRTAKFSGRKEDSFLKVLLDYFEPNVYISTNNEVFEPVYTDCIVIEMFYERVRISNHVYSV
jgi:hypothetical protein